MAKLRLGGSYTRIGALTILLIGAAVPAACAAYAGSAKGLASLTACLEEVAQGHGEEIACKYEALLTEEERSDLRRLSRELLQDAACLVDVRIARRLVEPALRGADLVFEAPPQPVSCTITTKTDSFPVTSTFAPRVVFKGGLAIEATPGMGEVTGINRYLAWPLVQYVNRAPGIGKSMIEIINALRPELATVTAAP